MDVFFYEKQDDFLEQVAGRGLPLANFNHHYEEWRAGGQEAVE